MTGKVLSKWRFSTGTILIPLNIVNMRTRFLIHGVLNLIHPSHAWHLRHSGMYLAGIYKHLPLDPG